MKSPKMLLLRLISLNVRYATKTPDMGEEPWKVRAPLVASQLGFLTSGRPESFICLQEVLHRQLVDLHALLDDSWASIGAGRDDGANAGEMSPIFYRRDVWDLRDGRTYWLSPTPSKPSRGWDAALNRVVTVGFFAHRRTKAQVLVMCTHLDHVGVTAREESAKLLKRLAAKLSREMEESDPEHPPAVFLAGDFNSSPSDVAYRTIVESPDALVDVSTLVAPERTHGNHYTYTAFSDKVKHERIDFVFTKPKARITIDTFGIMTNKFDDGIYLSDHRAVVSDISVHCKGPEDMAVDT